MTDFPRGLVWDLDGTLVDSVPDLAQALNTILNAHGHRTIAQDKVKSMIGNGVAKLIERGFSASGETLSPEQLNAILPRFMSTYSSCATSNSSLYPGAHSVLKSFSEAGVLQALCTNKPESISRKILADFNIAEFFTSVVGGDTTRRKKPDPMPLKLCLDTLKVPVEETIFIGDSMVDVATAQAVGIRVGLVAYGYGSQSVPSSSVDFKVDHLSDIPDAILSLNTQATSSCV